MLKDRFTFHWLQQELHRLTPPLKRVMGWKGYILLLCVAVGVISGLSAVLLKTFTHEWHRVLYSMAGKLPGAVWILPALPALGIFLCIIIRT